MKHRCRVRYLFAFVAFFEVCFTLLTYLWIPFLNSHRQDFYLENSDKLQVQSSLFDWVAQIVNIDQPTIDLRISIFQSNIFKGERNYIALCYTSNWLSVLPRKYSVLISALDLFIVFFGRMRKYTKCTSDLSRHETATYLSVIVPCFGLRGSIFLCLHTYTNVNNTESIEYICSSPIFFSGHVSSAAAATTTT